MIQDYMNFITAFTAIGTLVVTAAGLVAVYIQINKLRDSIWSGTHSKLCDQSFELIKFLAHKPETYDYFYNGKSLEEGNKDRVFILYAAEALANFLEHLILQQDNLPTKQWEVWNRFIYSTCRSSVVMRDFIKEHSDWYSDQLLLVIRECDPQYAEEPV